VNPFLLRSLMHAVGLVVAACLFWFLPFSPWLNAVLALVAWMVDGIAAERLFNARASQEDKMRDLRDRTDHPPS
jgi:membrane protein implicated in regulation of membrane protease activity